jgi:uncharacterized protein YbcI
VSLDGARDESRATQSITGRRVVAFTSGMDTSADIATEVFILETDEEGSEQ